MRKKVSRIQKLLLFIVFGFIFYTLFGFFAIPKLVQHFLQKGLTEALHRNAIIKEVKFNPFKLDMKIANIAVQGKKPNTTLFSAQSLSFDLESASIYKKALILSYVKLNHPKFYLERYKNGKLNIDDLLQPSKTKKDKPEPDNSSANFKFSIHNIELTQGRIDFVDRLEGAKHKIDKINIGIPVVSNLDHHVNTFVKPHLSFAVNGAPFDIMGSTKPFDVTKETKLNIDIKNLDLTHYVHYLPDNLNFQLASGQLSTKLVVNFSLLKDKKPAITLKGTITGSDIELTQEDGRLFYLKRINTDLAQTNILDFKLHIANLELDSPDLLVKRDSKGELNLTKLVSEQEKPTEKAPETGSDKQFYFKIDNISLHDGKIHYQDEATPSPFSINLEGLALGIKDLDPESIFNFDIAANIKEGGSIKIQGRTSLKADSAKADITLSGISLPIAQPYIEDLMNIALNRGTLDWQGKLEYTATQDKEVDISLDGDALIKKLVIVDSIKKKKVLACSKFRAKAIKFDMQPLAIKVSKLETDRLYAKIELEKDGTLNLTKLIKTPPNKKGEPSKEVSKKEPKGPKEQDQLMAQIDLIRIKNSLVEFSDYSIEPPFKVKLSKINGTIKGVSSKKGAKAAVQIEAKLNDASLLKITGKVSPLADPLYADLKIDVLDVGMPLFTPYAAKYIGYLIEKGKLNLDLHYLIDKGQIKASNQIFLDQFTLGNSVQSPDAPNLPIKLALSLLTDRKGRIKLNIPIEGKLDDPSFSVRGAVWRAIRNLIVKAATSPFALVGAIFGGGEELQTIPFQAGEATINEEAKKRLEVLKKMLKERPKLRIELTGYFDPEADTSALIEKQFNLAIKQAKFNDLNKKERAGLNIDQIEITPEEREKYLWKAYKQAKFKKPSHLFGIVKKQPPEIMEKMIKEHIKITQGDLRNLAMERAQAVKNYLISDGEIEPQRIFLVEPKALSEKSKSSQGPYVEISLK